VLLNAVLRYLPVDPSGVCVDGTLGGGGHARALAERLAPGGLVVGLDRDPEALRACDSLAADFGSRVRLVHGSFGALPGILRREGLGRVSGVLLDLGVSSRQLDAGEKGFSFLRDGPLDMRMDPAQGPTAAELVNRLPPEELARLFRDLGEEPRAARVAAAIAQARRRRPLETTAELARVVEEALGRRSSKHPATRVFQALRIAVNGELEALDAFLGSMGEVLSPGGRVVVISYHSLEDRRVKQAFRSAEAHLLAGEPGFRLLTRKAVKPERAEIVANPRARSAKLRAAERELPERSVH
jgi:16S rRNA (cytosine1402-N4)-methyltransferase